jgi:RND family efflux transporter MFP subunit
MLVGVGLVAFVGYRVYEVQQEQAAAGQKKKKGGARVVSVGLGKAEIGQVREELLLTGALKPKEQVAITPKATGRVEKIHFQVGDLVQAGAMIAELEDDELQQQVSRANASLAVARASVAQRKAERENTKADVNRADMLLKDGLISPQDFAAIKTRLDVLDAQVQLAEAQMQQAEAELRELKIRLEQTKIYSPMNGAIAARRVDEGALVSPNTPILDIVNLSTMKTQANVPERNIGKLRVGNQAIVRVDAIPDETFTGRVARIAPVLDAATRTALIEIDILNPGNRLKAEMFARIELDLGTMRNATLIPREGLVYRGQQPGVYVVDGDRPVFRAIETGLTRDENVEVLANLDAGTTIVGRGATMLREGDRIATGGGPGGKKGGDKSAENAGPGANGTPPAEPAAASDGAVQAATKKPASAGSGQ